MKILDTLMNLFKGGNHAGRTEESVSGGNGRERRILHSIPSICERAVSDIRGIRMLASACADERGRDTGTLSPDQIRGESDILIAVAKRIGCFMERDSVPGTRYTIRTGESEVRLVQREQLYYKVKNPFAKLHLKKHPPEYVLFEHVIHNVLFPDCRLEFLGVAEDIHEARLVFRQQAVRADARPDDRQIAEHLGRLGLRPEGRYAFANDYVFVTDVGQDGDNVLLPLPSFFQLRKVGDLRPQSLVVYDSAGNRRRNYRQGESAVLRQFFTTTTLNCIGKYDITKKESRVPENLYPARGFLLP